MSISEEVAASNAHKQLASWAVTMLGLLVHPPVIVHTFLPEGTAVVIVLGTPAHQYSEATGDASVLCSDCTEAVGDRLCSYGYHSFEP
ncbi:hypothetical protein AVEN_247718-1 [Araneus ventricosus]|uniref:Uncharacterized protein n=1 Tax=Araneus ventricosus TaxID=182803 RepID=A0A4Y2GNL7_ARAVE|nr:hypothetical protein AVEN_247718-1 [Araneus ventricosus]